MNNLYIIKDRLNEALKLRNMTAAELSKRSGIAKSSLSRYLTGENIPRSIAIGKMATALNVSPAWILGYNVTITGEDPEAVKIDIEVLSDANKTRLLAYYQALLDSQEDNNGNT